MPNERVSLLLAQMDYAFGEGGWYASMHKALDDLTAADAAWSPGPGVNTIWQQVNHLTFWKQIIANRMNGAPLTGKRISNDETFGAPGNPDDQTGWQSTLDRFYSAHQALRDALSRQDETALDEPLPGERTPLQELISGENTHDVYHLGQIVLLRKLRGRWKGNP